MKEDVYREIKLPEISEAGEETIITKWHVKVGDVVKEGEDMVEVATDKATFDVPFPCDGIMVSIGKKEGDNVDSGEAIAEIGEAGTGN